MWGQLAQEKYERRASVLFSGVKIDFICIFNGFSMDFIGIYRKMQCLYNCKNTKCPWSKVMLYIPPHMGSRNSMVAVAACGNAVLTVKNRFHLYFYQLLCIFIVFV